MNVARGKRKRAFKVFFSGDRLRAIVSKKRSESATYKPVPDKLVDFATFYGMVGRGYTEQKYAQLTADTALAKKHPVESLAAMREVAFLQATRSCDALIATASAERASAEEQASQGQDQALLIRKATERIALFRQQKVFEMQVVSDKYARPIELRLALDLQAAAKNAAGKRKRRALAAYGRGANSQKRKLSISPESDEDRVTDEDTEEAASPVLNVPVRTVAAETCIAPLPLPLLAVDTARSNSTAPATDSSPAKVGWAARFGR